MEISLKSKVAEIFTKYNFSKDDASLIADVIGEVDDRQDKKFEVSKELFLTQKDKVELIEKIGDTKTELIDRIQHVEKSLIRTIYIVGLVQFLAIVGSVLAIFNLMMK